MGCTSLLLLLALARGDEIQMDLDALQQDLQEVIPSTHLEAVPPLPEAVSGTLTKIEDEENALRTGNNPEWYKNRPGRPLSPKVLSENNQGRSSVPDLLHWKAMNQVDDDTHPAGKYGENAVLMHALAVNYFKIVGETNRDANEFYHSFQEMREQQDRMKPLNDHKGLTVAEALTLFRMTTRTHYNRPEVNNKLVHLKQNYVVNGAQKVSMDTVMSRLKAGNANCKFIIGILETNDPLLPPNHAAIFSFQPGTDKVVNDKVNHAESRIQNGRKASLVVLTPARKRELRNGRKGPILEPVEYDVKKGGYYIELLGSKGNVKPITIERLSEQAYCLPAGPDFL